MDNQAEVPVHSARHQVDASQPDLPLDGLQCGVSQERVQQRTPRWVCMQNGRAAHAVGIA